MSMKHFKDDFSVGTVMAVIGSAVGLKGAQRVTELASHNDYCCVSSSSATTTLMPSSKGKK